MVSGDVAVAQGRESVFWHTLRLLAPYWSRIDVLCPGAPGAAPRTLHGTVHVHPGARRRLLQPLFVVRRGRALAAAHRYGLIASHDFGLLPNGLAAWWLSRHAGVPFVSELHHVEGYPRAATREERLQRRVAGLYARWVGRRAAAIRVVNRVELPGFLAAHGVPPERVLVLPSIYLDLDTFRPAPDEAKPYDVLLVARLAPNKGVDLFLDAVVRLRRARPGLHACVLGDGPLRDHVQRRLQEPALAGAVELVPRVDSSAAVAQAYNRARVVVCTSTAEGGPRVTVEAMACAVPVVSTRVGLMPELVRDGENGFLVDWDADAVARPVELLLDDDALRARIGEAGRRTVAKLDGEAAARAYAEAYRALAAP
jgi:glycosyltransferase involved in cell wall biosynthesis